MFMVALRMHVGTRSMRRAAFMELVMPAPYLASVDRAALEKLLSGVFARDLADQPPIAMTQVRAMAKYDVFHRLGAIGSIPTIVASATHDRIARPEYGRELAAAIPGARYVEFAEAGHAVTIQCAAEINALLAAHFSSAESVSLAAV
jgi:3-oxoadipate enol-lactonase